MHRILSAHLDDAALSLGAFLSLEPGVVTTIFAGMPDEFGYVSDYDRSRGFATSGLAMTERRREDKAAMTVLGCITQHCGFLEHAYRGDDEPPCDQIIDAIRGIVSDEVHLFAPLGIGHPDHALLARLVRLACPPEILFYHDLPNTVLWPELVAPALDEIRAEGWTIDADPWPLPQGPRSLKATAIAKYRSQFPNGADDPCYLVPEKVWRATR